MLINYIGSCFQFLICLALFYQCIVSYFLFTVVYIIAASLILPMHPISPNPLYS